MEKEEKTKEGLTGVVEGANVHVGLSRRRHLDRACVDGARSCLLLLLLLLLLLDPATDGDEMPRPMTVAWDLTSSLLLFIYEQKQKAASKSQLLLLLLLLLCAVEGAAAKGLKRGGGRRRRRRRRINLFPGFLRCRNASSSSQDEKGACDDNHGGAQRCDAVGEETWEGGGSYECGRKGARDPMHARLSATAARKDQRTNQTPCSSAATAAAESIHPSTFIRQQQQPPPPSNFDVFLNVI